MEKAVDDEGKRLALITGRGSGIGRGFALKMTKLNHIVNVSDVKKDHIELAAGIGRVRNRR